MLFDIEIAKIKYVVSDATLGNIRFQWWRDAIDEIYDGKQPRRHEVVEPLAAVIKQYNLDESDFRTLIESRAAEIDHTIFDARQKFDNYLRASTYTLDRMVLNIIGAKEEESVAKNISSHFSLIRLIMTIPQQLSHGMLLLPQDMLNHYDLSYQKISDFRRHEELAPVVKELLDNNLVKAQPQTRFYKAMKKIALLFQEKLENNNCDVFSHELHQPIALKSLKIFLSSF